MKKVLLTASFLMLGATTMFAQKFITRTGKVSFNASAAKSPEKIEAINNEAAAIVDAKTGEVVFQVLIKSFKFERALMQEHFNENYMESDKYPKANFKGTITNAKDVNFTKDGTYKATVSGKMDIHGASNDVSVPGTITVKGGTVTLKAKFPVKLEDYKINIPAMVADKVGKEAAIDVDCDLAQK